jgi:exodeoxyribonuclease VII large subunit
MAGDLFGTSGKVLTVGELTRAIRGTLETKFGALWVQGEVSNYKQHPSGHQYFTLKDQRAAISCVVFRNTLPPSAKPLADGAQVQVYGRSPSSKRVGSISSACRFCSRAASACCRRSSKH